MAAWGVLYFNSCYISNYICSGCSFLTTNGLRIDLVSLYYFDGLSISQFLIPLSFCLVSSEIYFQTVSRSKKPWLVEWLTED